MTSVKKPPMVPPPPPVGLNEVAKAGLINGFSALEEDLNRLPALINRGVAWHNEFAEKYLPQALLLPIPNPFAALEDGFDLGPFHYSGTTPIANALAAERNAHTETDPAAKVVAQKAAELDDALTHALKTGDPSQLFGAATDPATLVASISSSAPGLMSLLVSGGSLKLATLLAALSTTSNVAEFETATGVKVSPSDFLQAQAESTVVNALLMRFAAKGLMTAKPTVGTLATSALKAGVAGALEQSVSNVAAWHSYNPSQPLTAGVANAGLGGAGTAGLVVGARAFSQARGNALGLSMAVIEGNETFNALAKKLSVYVDPRIVEKTGKTPEQVFVADPELVKQVADWSVGKQLPQAVKSVNELNERLSEAYRAKGHRLTRADVELAVKNKELGAAKPVDVRDPQRFKKFIADASPLHKGISQAERYQVIRDVPVKLIDSAPGHKHLRSPEAMLAMAKTMESRHTGEIFDGNEPIRLNVFTSPSEGVRVKSIEVTDGNHRLAAGLYAGKWKTLKDIPQRYLDIEVNGFDTDGVQHPRWIPLDVAKQSKLPPNEWFEVPAEWGAKGPTAQVSGGLSSQDQAISEKYRGVSLEQVIETSLDRVHR